MQAGMVQPTKDGVCFFRLRVYCVNSLSRHKLLGFGFASKIIIHAYSIDFILCDSLVGLEALGLMLLDW